MGQKTVGVTCACGKHEHIGEVELIQILYDMGISLDYITGAYYALEAASYHRMDEIFGSSEAGLHGKNAGRK